MTWHGEVPFVSSVRVFTSSRAAVLCDPCYPVHSWTKLRLLLPSRHHLSL